MRNAASPLGRAVGLLGPSLISLLVALTISAIVIAVAGGSPLLAFQALLHGAFGSADGLSEVAVKSCPLLFTGIAMVIAFRAGVWNIGAEGQLLLGAIVMAWLGTRVTLPAWIGLPLVLAATALAGALWAAIAAILKQQRAVSEVISTIMLNFVALQLVSYLVHGPLMEAAGQYPQSDAVGLAMRLPRLFAAHRIHVGFLVALAAAGLAQVLLFRTVFGFTLRATGLNPTAARLAGLAAERATFLSLVLSGALAGLAGGVEVSATTYRLYEQFSPGWGFTAIAVALLGRLNPGGAVVAALFFGALDAGSFSMQRAAGISSVLVSIIQATVIFGLVAVEGGTWLATSRVRPQQASAS